MTTFGQEMRELAVELTEEFSEEIGKSTFIYDDGSTYDPVSGDTTVVTFQETAYVTFGDITLNEVKDQSFIDNHMKAIVAGNNITRDPVKDTIIVHAATGVKHRVANQKYDQYKAAHILYIERKHA